MRKFVATKVMDSVLTKYTPSNVIRDIMERVINKFDYPLYRRNTIIDEFIDIISNDSLGCYYGFTEYTVPGDASVYADKDLAEKWVNRIGGYYLQYTLKCHVNHDPRLPDKFYNIMVFKHTLIDTDYDIPEDKDIIRNAFDKTTGEYRIKCKGLRDYIGKEDPSEDVNETMPNVTITPPSTPTYEEKPSKPKEKKVIKVMKKPKQSVVDGIKRTLKDLDKWTAIYHSNESVYDLKTIAYNLQRCGNDLKKYLKELGIK